MVRILLQSTIWLWFRFSKTDTIYASLLVVTVLTSGGCARPDPGTYREDAIEWISASDGVALRSSTHIGNEQKLELFEHSVLARMALSRPDSSHSSNSNCQLSVFIYAREGIDGDGELSASSDYVYLEVEGYSNRIRPSKKSWIEHWTFGGQGLEAVICFDFSHLDSLNWSTAPITIHLDSVLNYDDQIVSLGRIEMENFNVDIADYIADIE